MRSLIEFIDEALKVGSKSKIGNHITVKEPTDTSYGVINYDDGNVAALWYSDEEDFYMIQHFVVKVSRRREGIGTLLLRKLQDIAQDNKRDILAVAMSNNKNLISDDEVINFFKSCGFERANTPNKWDLIWKCN